MTVARLAVSLDAALARAIRRAAGKEPISSWLADAAERKLRAEGLLRVVADFETQSGAFSEDEVRASERRLAPAKKRAAPRR